MLTTSLKFTFKAGKWSHLGEATLMNRIKSHPDVGERFYPELLAQIRLEQAHEAATKQDTATLDAMKQAGQAIEAH